jgi:hypothetical protein
LQDQAFNKVIADIVLAFDKAGVYDSELKKLMDRLFDLKEFLVIKEALTKDNSTCYTCSFYDKGYCTSISVILGEGIELSLFKPGGKNLRVKVPMTFRCKLYKPR